jgi:hypothetical protein
MELPATKPMRLIATSSSTKVNARLELRSGQNIG